MKKYCLFARMKTFCLVICTLFAALMATAQGDDPKSQYDNAKTFMRQGDFDNAIILLNRALEKDRNNPDMMKDLAMSYYYKRDYAKALDEAKLLLDRNDADVVCYQI
ncbi:MAG TPA: tetratricopeptide repeat protein, partial [Chitinophagaceae bacterium]